MGWLVLECTTLRRGGGGGGGVVSAPSDVTPPVTVHDPDE